MTRVLINCEVDGNCSYKRKTENFHSFTDKSGKRHGFAFHTSDASLQQAERFVYTLVSNIDLNLSTIIYTDFWRQFKE